MFSNGFRNRRGVRRELIALSSALVILTSLVADAGARTRLAPRNVSTANSATSQVGAPVDATVADFNGDRHLDVVEALTGEGLTVRWGIAKGSYGDPVAIDAKGVVAKRVLSADVTSDGRPDVIAYTPGAKTIWVVVADGANGFLAPRSMSLASGVRAVAVGDFDRNGGQDLAVASATSAEVVIYSNRDDRSGFEPHALAVASSPLSIASIALDADARPDLVVGLSDRSVAVLKNVGGDFAPTVTRALDFTPDFIATGDLNADGWADVVAAAGTGKMASFTRVDAAISEPVVSDLSAPLNKIDLGFIDADAQMDVVGSGAGISMVFAGVGDGSFLSPRQAAEPTDVKSVTVLKDSGGRQNSLLISRPAGIMVEKVTSPLDKLRATFSVTNTFDEFFICPGDTLSMAPAGSLREAVRQANITAGPDTIVFNLTPDSPGYPTGFANTTLTWNIVLGEPITIVAGNGDGTQILGETALDTNPFGPDVVIQPIAEQEVRAALQDDAPAPEVPPLEAAFIVEASGCTISSLVISGTDFSGFVDPFLQKCSDPMADPTAVEVIDTLFANGIKLVGGNNVVVGCYIGTNERGIGIAQSVAVGNESGGVVILGPGNRVGGSDASDRNIVVSGNDGIRVFETSGAMLINNIVGTDGTVGGAVGGGNPLRGVLILDSDNTTITNCTVGGSARSGVLITNGSSGTVISNSAIGVNRQGQPTNTQNSDGGIVINASSSTTIGPANNISSNAGGPDAVNSGGVVLSGSSVPTTDTSIADNAIANNSQNGVIVSNGDDNTIGPNNTIASNTAYGVAVAQGTGNTITKNAITSNGTLGINLVGLSDPTTGITPNDANDADSGPNDLLNFPVFNASTVNATQVTVSGTAPAGSLVEIFKSDEAHPNGEGFEFLVQTTATGGTFSVALPITLPLQDELILTATATLGGNTSEFGPNFTLNQRINVSPSSITFPTTAVGGTTSQTVTICNQGVSNLAIASVGVEPSDGVFAVTGPAVGGITLAPGECTTVTVTFSPTAESNFTGTLVIASDDPSGDDVRVPLGGTAILGTITVNVASISIPVTPVGGTRSASVTVSNPTSIAVTVTRVDFLRRNTNKVTFADRKDPFFQAVPSTFTIPAGGSVPVQILFSPDVALRTPDRDAPFDLPTPAYQTPKKIKTDVTFVVSDQLGIAVTVPAQAKVSSDPIITDIRGPGTFTDSLELTLDVYDPDNNVDNVQFVFFNEAGGEITRIDNTPNVARALRKYAKGMTVPLKLTLSGLTQFGDSLRLIRIVVEDAQGNISEPATISVRQLKSKAGDRQFLLSPGLGALIVGMPSDDEPGIDVPVGPMPRR